MIQPHSILVVDDDASVREMLVRVLNGEGYQAWAVASGEEALALSERHRFDLVMLDLTLPEKTGWDVFEALVNRKPFLPVVIITARSNQLFTALSAGVAALLEKPFDFPKLLQTIHELLTEPREAQLQRLAGGPASFHFHPRSQSREP